MAVLKFGSDYYVDMSGGGGGIDAPEFEVTSEKHTSTALTFYMNSKSYVSFGGTSLRYEMQSGYVSDVIGGQMTSMKIVFEGKMLIEISSFKQAATTFFDKFQTDGGTFLQNLLSGSDTIHGTRLGDVLIGYGGNDVLKGNAGNDKLYGGTGADDLYGGSGKDAFAFKAVKESTVSSSGRDTIFDFDGAGGDRIDLSAIDANSKTSKNDGFDFIGSKHFTGKAGEVRYEKQASDTYIYADINGDQKVDFAVHLDDAINVTKGYLVL